MSETSKSTQIAKNARTGEFVVAKPAVGPKKFTIGQIRAAVLHVNNGKVAKAK
jgi:hypothetical protein